MSRIIDFLIRSYEYDIAVLTEPWMYYPLLIPVLFYLAFFFVKWAVLTAPLWLPVSLALSAMKPSVNVSTKLK